MSETAQRSSLETARHHHAHGNLLAAAESYRQLLAADPTSPEALLGLSLIARQSNQPEPGFRMAQAALAANPSSPYAWANLGDLLCALNHSTHAQTAFRHALKLQPNLAAAHFGLGNAQAHADNFADALTSFQLSVEHAPQSPESHFALAFALAKFARHTEAIAHYRQAIQLRPGFPSAWLNLGVELLAAGRPEQASFCYHQALRTATPSAVSARISALINLGNLHRSLRHYPQAAKAYAQALETAQAASSNRLAEIHIALAYHHIEQRQYPQAWQALREAETANLNQPPNPEIPNARGVLLLAEETATSDSVQAQGLANEAISAFHEAESQGHKSAPSNRGNALLRLGRCEEALAAHQAAIALAPHHPGIRYNLALTQLRLGDFQSGWPNYESRWQFREVHPRPRSFQQPLWDGQAVQPDQASPTHLFLYGEQGLGDTLQFLRYLPLVVSQLAGVPQVSNLRPGNLHSQIHLTLEVQPPLTRLLSPYIAELAHTHPNLTLHFQTPAEPLPDLTHHIPLMSLPALFQTTLAGTGLAAIPPQPILNPNPELTQHRARELASLGNPNQPAIGLAWAGNPNYRSDHERSTSLSTFQPLLELPNLRWISLQKGEAAPQIANLALPGIQDMSSQDRDLADTAALIANLDLVLTTDTAIAHLAASLHKPTWILLPWQSDWRWMQHRLDTPWYPTVRLFRQPSRNNWPELIQQVSNELQQHPPAS